VLDPALLGQFRQTLARLRQGPNPKGETFEMCREVLAAAPASEEAATALRLLLEGAMADASTSIADAQVIMQLLKALDKGQVTAQDLLP
jgi:hypothetical protein